MLEQEPVPPRDLNPTVDRELEMICLKCLQKPAELRYATAAALAADLEAYAAGETIAAAAERPAVLPGAAVPRDAPRRGARKLGQALDVAQPDDLLAVPAHASDDWRGVNQHVWYLGFWSVGLVTWGDRALATPQGRAGRCCSSSGRSPTPGPRASCASIGMFVDRVARRPPVLTLSPAVAVAAGMVMVFKAGILSGRFYGWAAANFAAAVLMTLPRFRDWSVLIFGVVSALSFFVPGLKYYRQRRARSDRSSS